ncbi:hypothetical protein RHSIM_Rhsim02G0061700 [Rhododendron simsii]|uniref:RRM domain-containing protein n=1 Tax=Rhododendron simsii TaxID=118357 RepID=A0A834LW45_RHOSS|nr:hypothetical protein RHSIM_Rhsim02G0061700 [Rhododendron simsii]
MAFYGRLGSLMRQTVSQPSGQVPMASMLNTIRCMSSSKLFIGGLSYGTNDDSLRDAFSGFGQVVEGEFKSDLQATSMQKLSSRVITDRDSVRLTYLLLLFQPLDGRNIRVNYANDRPSAPRTYGGGGGGGGGYRGGFGDARENDGF